MTHLDVVGNFHGPPQRRYDPYAYTYNPGWRDHPNLSYGANPRYNQPYQNRKTKASVRELTTSLEKMSSQGKLPSQTELNPRQNVNVMMLQSGKMLEPNPGRNLGQEIAQEKPKNVEQAVTVGENVSAVLQRKMPGKCKDRGMFAIPCKIGFLMKIGVIIQLADRSIVHPEGVLEDILVKVNKIIFPTDFYVIEMEEDSTLGSSNLLLGKPFLSTASIKIDVRSGTLTMEFDGEIVNFNVYDAISHPSEILSIYRVDIIDSLLEKTFESIYEDKSEFIFDDHESVNELLSPSNTKILPSVVQAPYLELKPLPKHLKYAFLGKGNTLLIIVSNKLSKLEEERSSY
ncbi:uncharacterized protein [Gossypium hirsutum]|uniref:Reverse transcriptase domain-containing protein n=1 Tax=Gossypium hirsutum TaxID=3635 RepID=A0ABM2YVI8_GOSHI|nr:uncharacterized protein LOC121208052 [Gossypium hirsutum]